MSVAWENICRRDKENRPLRPLAGDLPSRYHSTRKSRSISQKILLLGEPWINFLLSIKFYRRQEMCNRREPRKKQGKIAWTTDADEH